MSVSSAIHKSRQRVIIPRSLGLFLFVCWALFVAANVMAQQPGDASAGQVKAQQCAGCHGSRGEGAASNPKIAGLAPDVFTKAITDFRSGDRKSPMMGMVAKKLSDQDIADLAAYFSGL